MLSPEYCAGLFDGEGTASLIYTVVRRRNGSTSDIPILGFKFRVQVANTYRPVLDALQVQFDGMIYGQKRLPRHRRVFTWVLSGAVNQRRFLLAVEPHVVIRREHVRVGLRFLDTVGPVGTRKTQAEWDERVACHRLLEVLNIRGDKKPPIHSLPEAPPDGWSPRRRYSPEQLAKFMAHVRAGDGTSRHHPARKIACSNS